MERRSVIGILLKTRSVSSPRTGVPSQHGQNVTSRRGRGRLSLPSGDAWSIPTIPDASPASTGHRRRRPCKSREVPAARPRDGHDHSPRARPRRLGPSFVVVLAETALSALMRGAEQQAGQRDPADVSACDDVTPAHCGDRTRHNRARERALIARPCKARRPAVSRDSPQIHIRDGRGLWLER
jgi:hypothetical protein